MERERSFSRGGEAMQRFSPIHWISLFLLLCLCSFGVKAQTTASMTGTVKDQQGIGIPGATVQVTSAEMGIDRTTTSESDGVYTVAALPPGIYTVKASHDGFQTQVFKDIDVEVNRILNYDITLSVGTA